MFGSVTAGHHGSSYAPFPDPSRDIARALLPTTERNAIEWATSVYYGPGPYRPALERVGSYFLTSLEFKGISPRESKDIGAYLHEELKMMRWIWESTMDRMACGNSMNSVLRPFKRFVVCPKCRLRLTLKEVKSRGGYKYVDVGGKPKFDCPHCRQSVTGYYKDEDDPNSSKIKLHRWDPRQIHIKHDIGSGDNEYYWQLPEDYKADIRRGDAFTLERASKAILDCAHNDMCLRFDEDMIYHMREPCLASVRNMGWGIPRIYSSFHQIYYVQVLRRAIQAFAIDYVIPLRIVTPAPKGGFSGAEGMAQDPSFMQDGANFSRTMQQIYANHRKDPAGVYSLPFPVQYQLLGGEGKQLFPLDALVQGQTDLLNEVGVPLEFMQGTLKLETAPVASRIMESTWRHLVIEIVGMINWAVKQICEFRSWDCPRVELRSPQLVDDISQQMALLQLMTGGQISGSTGLKQFRIDWEEEQEKLINEQETIQQLQLKAQKRMEQQGFASEVQQGAIPNPQLGAVGEGQGNAQPQQPAPGTPGTMAPGSTAANMAGPDAQSAIQQLPIDAYIQTMGSNMPVTVEDQTSAAQYLAEQLGVLPEGLKDSQLRKLKQFNGPLHAYTKELLAQNRKTQEQQLQAAMQQQPPPAA